jgi:methyl-accepting chemotaxis protein
LASLEARAMQISFAATSIMLAAEAAGSALPEIADGMSRQQAAVAEIARKLKSLEARSEEVGQIVEMLDDVTSETNILSLNAAIEASRAGAQGKGFGLVAEEVRKMAERAATATKDIGAYLETIASATGDATRAIESVRNIADHLAALTARASSEAGAGAEMRKAFSPKPSRSFASPRRARRKSRASCTSGAASLRACSRLSRHFWPARARRSARPCETS